MKKWLWLVCLSLSVFPTVAARAALRLVKTIPVFALGLDVNEKTNQIYTAGGSLNVINGATHELSGELGRTNGFSVAVDEGLGLIYSIAYVPETESYCLAVTTATGNRRELPQVPLQSESNLAVNSTTHRVYAATNAGLLVIDGSSYNIIARLNEFGNPGVRLPRLAVNPRTNRVYVTQATRGVLGIIDGADNHVLKTLTVATPVAESAHLDVAVNTRSGEVAIVSSNDSTLEFRDGQSGALLSEVALSYSPRVVAWNERNNQVYVDGGNGLTAYYTRSSLARATVNVKSVIAISVNSSTGFIYAIGFESNEFVLYVLHDDFVRDVSAPTITISFPANGAKSDYFIGIGGRAQDNEGGAGVDRVTVTLRRSSDGKYFSGRNWGATPIAIPLRLSSSGYFSDDLPNLPGRNLQPDVYFATITAFDQSFPNPNHSSVTVSFRIIDALAPIVNFTYPPNRQQLAQLTKISGTLTDDVGGVGPSRVLVQIRRVSDAKYFDGTRWTSSAVALPTRLIGTGRAVAFELDTAYPPAQSGTDIFRITAVGFDRSFNRSVAQTIEVRVGMSTTGT